MRNFFKKLSTDRTAIFILGVGIFGMFWLPYLITKQSWFYDLDVEKSNEIGDTIGGILGPFIGLISAGFVYLALREQVIANQKIQDHFEIERKEKFEHEIFDYSINRLQIFIEIINTYTRNMDVYGHFDFLITKRDFFQSLSEDLGIKNSENLNFKDDDFIPEVFINEIHKLVEFFTENVRQEDAFKIIFLDKLKLIISKIDFILETLKLRIEEEPSFEITDKTYETILSLISKNLVLKSTIKSVDSINIQKESDKYDYHFQLLNTKLSYERKFKKENLKIWKR